MPPVLAKPPATSVAAGGSGASAAAPHAPETTRSKGKSAPTGDKVVVRRLPPALTKDEFLTTIGPLWHPGGGKIGWFTFEPGKISKDPSKPPKPARAYLQVLRKDDLFALSEAVRTASWEDAAGSHNHSGYMGPPIAEFSIYKKIPNMGRKKPDSRQGTIDQDPEFMDFLEKLANPPAKADEASADKPDDPSLVGAAEVTTTPLIEAIREKKAAKAKEAANAKSVKQAQAAAKEKKKSKDKDKDKDKKRDRPKETVKILTKKAAQEAAAGAARSVASKIVSAQPQQAQQSQNDVDAEAPSSPKITQKSRRAGIAAAARILQRDLGISPGSAHRRVRRDFQKAEAEAKESKDQKDVKEVPPASPKPELASTKKPTSRPSTPTAPKAQQQAAQQQSKKGKGKQQASGDAGKGKSATAPPSEPKPTAPTPIVILKKEKKPESPAPPTQPAFPTTTVPPAGPGADAVTPTTPAATPVSAAAAPPPSAPTGPKAGSKKGSAGKPAQKKAPTPQVSTGATRGFVKHANPSQGVTEQLLKKTFENYGTVTFVEIDRRKGFAYVDFSDHDGLVKAISASPIHVAQATVQVLERRDKQNAQKAGSQGPGNEKVAGTGGKVGKKDKEKEKETDGAASKSKENQLPDGGSSPVAAKSAPPSAPAEKSDGAGSGKPRVRRGGRGRGARGRDVGGGGGGAGGAGGSATSQQPSAPAQAAVASGE